MALADPAPDDLSDEAVLKKALKMTSAVATMVAAHHRIRNGNEPVEPNSDLAHAANFLYMLHGETPSAEDARLIDKDMVCTRSTAATRLPSRRAWPPRPAPTSTPH